MSENKNEAPEIPDEIFELLTNYLRRIRFGSVSLIIQNGKIVQIETSEKIRTDKI